MTHARVIGLFLVMLIISACGTNLAGEPEIVSTLPPPPTAAPTQVSAGPVSAPNIAHGSMIFASNCTDCHGEGGAGDGELVLNEQIPNPGDMTDRAAVSADTPEEWYNTITNGRIENLMPPWNASLNEEERWSVAMYTYTLHYQPEEVEAGETVFTANFSALDTFNVDDPQALVSVSDQEIYNMLAAESEDLSEDDLWNTVAYVRTRSLAGVEAMGQPAPTMPDAEMADAANAEEAVAAPVTEAIAADVNGLITNGTGGGSAPDEATVELYVLNESAEGIDLVESVEATATNGEFTFGEMEIQPNYTYIAVTSYRDRQFISQPTRGMNAQVQDGELNLPIEVFDLTDDSEVISMERMVVQINAQEDGLQVAQVAAFNNTSDRVFTSSQPLNEQGNQFGSTVMYLPPGAVVTGFMDSNRYIYSEEDFAVIDTQPVMPTSNPGSEHIMQVVYFLPYEDGAIIEHPLAYDVDGSVRLLVSPEGLEVESEQLLQVASIPLGDASYMEYVGDDISLEQGDTVSYVLSGSLDRALAATRTTTTGSSRSNPLPTILFVISGITGTTAVGLFVYGRYLDRKKKPEQDIDKLVAEIAELDRQHEAGTLNHDLWHRQRNELKAQLKTLMEKSNE